MQTLAVIGSGIAGLSCAYFLKDRFDLTLFERNDYPGGHTNTVTVEGPEGALSIDTGFMVYNRVTYPNLIRLFDELGVETQPTSMSFSVQYRPLNLEFSGSSLNHLFAQRKNLFNPRYIRMLLSVNRFNQDAVEALNDPAYEEYTVLRYVTERRYGDDFLNAYLIPMSSAVWSTPPEKMLSFPARTLIRFFHNHGFLGLHTQHPWRTVTGGARSYVQKMTAGWRDKIRLNAAVSGVRRNEGRVDVTLEDGSRRAFDRVIIASHADQALRMLADPTPLERGLLSAFKYQYNKTLLHRDASVMPRTKRAWSSWNYAADRAADGSVKPSVHYWMNSLQDLPGREQYFVSLNAAGIDPAKVVRTIDYEHPLFDLGALIAQKELPGLNRAGEETSTYYCGSYFKYGFHEDALSSAVELCRQILKEPLWKN